MFDREKAEPPADIEFDFFDESPTVEATPKKDSGPRRKRRMPKRPPRPPGGPQLYRLGILIAGAIVLAAILILVVNSCRENRKVSAYEGYVEDVSAAAAESEALGEQLNTAVNTPGVQLDDLRADVEGLRGQQAQILATVQDLQPPGPLVEQHQSLVETMQFRVSGLAGLAEALGLVAQTAEAEQSAARLATQAQRLVASDVVYEDVFQAPTQETLREQGVENVPVPASKFVKDPELASPAQWTLAVRRFTQGPQSGGLHGNGIEAVRVQPGGQQLSASEDNEVRASDDLEFQVLVLNSGDSQETQVVVQLVIQQEPVIRKQQVIQRINPGETKTVTFRDFPNLSFSTQTTLKVTVEPVPGEENTGNNTAQYPIVFTLG
ncbi:MAG TPA: CARDB domain-containing protein [Gaiellaceae bacterium]|nr:CARDB domain-containing protein [Gaiellaceae bacterium]